MRSTVQGSSAICLAPNYTKQERCCEDTTCSQQRLEECMQANHQRSGARSDESTSSSARLRPKNKRDDSQHFLQRALPPLLCVESSVCTLCAFLVFVNCLFFSSTCRVAHIRASKASSLFRLYPMMHLLTLNAFFLYRSGYSCSKQAFSCRFASLWEGASARRALAAS